MPDSPHCSACDAVCCRLTVVLQPGDSVPAHFTTWSADGLEVMARDEEGWCVAIDPARMQCRIYDTRPANCRRFAMAGSDCRQVRADYSRDAARRIPLQMA